MRSLIVVLLLAPTIRAAEPDPVKEAVTATIEAARKRDWPAYAKTLHPADLKAFRDDWVPLLEGLKKAEADKQKSFLEMFPGAMSVDAVLKYTPEEFLAKIMVGTDRGELYKGPTTEKSVILGVVPEGDGQAHAVVRVTRKWAGAENSSVDLMSVKKADGVWKTELPPVLKQLGLGMRASYSAKPGTATAEDKVEPDPVPPKK